MSPVGAMAMLAAGELPHIAAAPTGRGILLPPSLGLAPQSEERHPWYDDVMGVTPEAMAFDRGVGPLLRRLMLDRADAVLSFRPEAALSARIEELATKSTEGQLSGEERAEYEGYVRANNFIAILRRQARRLLVQEQ